MSTKAPGEILELFRGGYLSMAETIDALDAVEGYVSVELLNIERAVSDDLREQNAQLREELRSAHAQCALWQPIETAPFQQTVILSRKGEKLCVTAYRIGPVAGWRHAHSSDSICFEPTHWTDLPEPPTLTSTERK